jgi:DNA-binding transcriptional LysR family regulator
VLVAIDDAEASMVGRRDKPRGLLRLTVPDAYGRLVLLPLIRKYLDTWPDVQVEVSLPDRRVDIIEEGMERERPGPVIGSPLTSRIGQLWRRWSRL